MFLSVVLFGIWTQLSGPGQISFRYPESRSQVCSSGASFRFSVLFLDFKLRDKVSLLLTRVPKLRCVSFIGLGLGVKPFSVCVGATDQGFFWGLGLSLLIGHKGLSPNVQLWEKNIFWGPGMSL